MNQLHTQGHGGTMMALRQRSVEIFAKSLYRHLLGQGYDRHDIVRLVTALLDQLLNCADPR